MRLKDIIQTEKQIIADGNSIENNIITSVDIVCMGHFGNIVSLDIMANNCCWYSCHCNTDNIGWQIKALVELFDLTKEDGFRLTDFKNIPCRIITEGSGGWGVRIIGFGHFMKNKFVYKEDFARIDEL